MAWPAKLIRDHTELFIQQVCHSVVAVCGLAIEMHGNDQSLLVEIQDRLELPATNGCRTAFDGAAGRHRTGQLRSPPGTAEAFSKALLS